MTRDDPIKDIRYLFKQKKEDNSIKEKTLRDIRTLFEPEEDYYEPIQICNAFDDNYIEYESNGDKDKTLSIKEYLNEFRLYLNNIINDPKTEGESKIQLTMGTNSFSSKDSKETCTVHSKRNNIEIMISNETDEIIE